MEAASLIGVPVMASVVGSLAGLALSVAMPHAEVSLKAISVVQFVVAPTFWWLCLRTTRNKYLFVASALQLSGALGNIANMALHPFGVVDFMVIPAISPDYIFNLADVAILLSVVLLLAYPLVAVFGYAPGFASTWSKLVWPIEGEPNPIGRGFAG